jgi:hypothetical protein
MGNVSNKRCRENQDIHFIFSNFFAENHAVYEIKSKNLVEPEAVDSMVHARCMLHK